MQELDQAQTGHLKQISRQNRYQFEDLERQIDQLRNENLDLKTSLRELNRDRLVASNANELQQQWQRINPQPEYDEYGQELSHGEEGLHH